MAGIRNTGSVKQASKLAGIERTMHYRRLKADPAYCQAYQEALIDAAKMREDAARDWENEAIRRAVKGWIEPVIFQGQLCYQAGPPDLNGEPTVVPLTVRKFDSETLRFLLRGAMPEKYRERHSLTGQIDVTARFAGSLTDLLATYRHLTEEEPAA